MEKKNMGLIITIIILAICVLGLSAFVIFDKVINKEKAASNAIDEKALAAELWDIFDITDGCGDNYYFLDDNLSYNSTKLIEKNNLGQVVNDIRLKLAVSITQPERKWKENDCSEFSIAGACDYISYSKEKIQNNYARLFGSDKKLENNNFELDEFTTCEISNNTVVCHEIASGNTCDNLSNTTTSIVSTNYANKKFEIVINKNGSLKYKLTFNQDNSNWNWVKTEIVK